ncbi:MAG: hypothetical protein M1838_002673 [Thelocarpon superellum]|nr:MAG: hypothetical protein M1838_002673 [Thelocarpon superellum]
MPEIGEVARVVHYLRKHLVGKTLASVKVQDDTNVYNKVGTTAAEFQKGMVGKKVLDARQQGKYFWLVMSAPPHGLFHLGMTAWIKFSNEDTTYYRSGNGAEEAWPPKYWKFILETKEEPKCQAAFVDSRRFGRIRLLDCDQTKIRQVPPLSENGPDPVQDRELVTKDWFVQKVRSKKVPVKAFLLNQANLSGVGNWVGDEILYHAKIHPEQYTDSLRDAQLVQLHKSLHHICTIAVDTLADSNAFPAEWLMKYRWGKGKKDNKLPNGNKIIFLTVGGRTSAVVPSVQKKTGPVAGDFDADEVDSEDLDESTGIKDEGQTKNAAKHAAKPIQSARHAETKKTSSGKVSPPVKSPSTKKRKAAGAAKGNGVAADERPKADNNLKLSSPPDTTVSPTAFY